VEEERRRQIMAQAKDKDDADPDASPRKGGSKRKDGQSIDQDEDNQVSVTFKVMSNKTALTMGQPKKALETSLGYSEQQILKKERQDKLAEIARNVDEKYHDDFNKSIMISESDTKAKNEILRKIKLYKSKKTNLQDFVRKRKDELLTTRLEEQRAFLQYRGQMSSSTLNSTTADNSPKHLSQADKNNISGH